MNAPYKPYIQPLIGDLLTRSQRAALGLLGVSSKPLRTFLTNELSKPAGVEGSLLADPVFEATFGWTLSGRTMDSLAGSLLHRRLVEVMAKPPEKLAEDYEFPRDRQPFSHQLEAWQILTSEPPRSLVVTSGTGSGKTECFLVPILNRLTRQAEVEGRLRGVRALLIYPLNALIASQKNRLDAWTDGLNGDVRYGLYTGEMREEAPSRDREYAGQVIDRKTLRDDVPPVLITNATMLEYMLVRREDSPILAASQGKLEWIVLDEAHTHIGSQAAEMALLLRRVMLAFGVKPENVRFIATSATFGADDKTTNQLKAFLAQMAGVSSEQIHVVHGRRNVPDLVGDIRPEAQAESLAQLAELESANEISDRRYRQLSTHPMARALRSRFVNQAGTRVNSLKSLQADFPKLSSTDMLSWLDLLSGTRNGDEQSFLPLRIHLFHKVISGLHACVDSACPCKVGTALDDAGWGFGMVYGEERTHCQCGAPVLPLLRCGECNELHLYGMDSGGRLQAIPQEDEDEFQLDRDIPEDNDAEKDQQAAARYQQRLLLLSQAYEDSEEQWLSRDEGCWLARAQEGGIAVRLQREIDGQFCPQCKSESADDRLFRRLAIGTPFTLGTVISTLLEYCPEDPVSPSTKPFGGRKLISFTDSRQGTARTAAKLQQDSERNRVRALVYHHLLAAQGSGKLPDDDEHDLADLLLEKSQGSLSSRDEKLLNKLLADKVALQQPELTWRELQQRLAAERDVKEGLLDYYSRLFPSLFERNVSSSVLASMFLFREFARRPKRVNSLESMGLVQLHYPLLEQINNGIPDGWPSDMTSWRHYLKVLLDFYVRENTFIQIDDRLLKVIGNRFSPKWLVAPTQPDKADKRSRLWPQVNPKGSQPRPVKLLMRAFNWSAEAQRDQMDAILRTAWGELVRLKLLSAGESGYQLRLEDVSFRLISKAAICPITRRLLDTAFEGLTPYSNPKNPDAACNVTWVDVPLFPYPFGNHLDDRQRIAQARTWLAAEPDVQLLRDEGLWTDLADRIVEGGAYFRAAEHSAQQNRKTLERYEDDFKAGKLNLMSCSTTMEMGVDIGGISVVAMNNVPPHPANYLQRAGRAGRRREARAIALTVCKNTPHDQSVFDLPTWPFASHIAVPAVSLQSPELIIRHVNSWLLSCWLKHIVKRDEIRKMTCGVFFIPDGEWSVADRFVTWCRHPEVNLTDALRMDLARLVANTPLAAQKAERLLMNTLDRMVDLVAAWRKQHESLAQQRAIFGANQASNKALQALNLQIERLEGEYLLSELANRRFLPGYGFPTDVVSLDNRNRESLVTTQQEREDNRGRRLQLPSRDRATALREYAPGAEIVLDGLVYRSAGVTLNWHIPANEEEIRKEAQLFKFAWRCHHCGASGSEIGYRPEVCPEPDCGHALRDDQIHQYLVPSGFAVDFFETPHNDFSSPAYVPVKQPWLSVKGGWLALANPMAGRFRASSRAHLYHHSAGANGCGYALCLECGRAEPMLSRPDPETHSSLPEVFRKPHRRLRGDREEKTGGRVCLGSDDSWKIKQGIVLGHDSITDALELILRTPEGSLLNDETIAFTLAVALRGAIADSLGVMAEELGCSTRVLWLEGQEARVIQVFDARSGGYSVLAAPKLLESSFWGEVRRQLVCHANCASACPHCLLSFDTRFAAEHLDRHQALGLLTPQWLANCKLAPEFSVFGPDTLPESTSLLDAIERTLLRPDANAVRLYWHGDATTWDLPSAHALGAALPGWMVRGLSIDLCAEQGSLSRLSEENRYKLASLLELGAHYYELAACDMLAESSSLPLLAAVRLQDVWHGWVSDTPCMGLPNETWGMTVEDNVLLHGICSLSDAHNAFANVDVRPKTGDLELDIRTQLDGKIESFGQAFWQLLCEKSPTLANLLEQDELSLVSYADRYLRSPLPVSLLLSVFHGLTKYPAALGGRRECVVRSMPFINERGTSNVIWHDWANHEKRDAVLGDALAYLGFEAQVLSEKDIPHGRLLEITFTSGKQARIRLDQGLSFWHASRDIRHRSCAYPFQETAERQVDLLVNPFGGVEAPPIVSTQLFIRIV